MCDDAFAGLHNLPKNMRPLLVFCIDSVPVRDSGDTFVMVIFALCSRLCNPSDHILRKLS